MEKWGGDTTQVIKTGESLKRLGVAVDISSDVVPNLNGYDLVHIFNIQTSKTGIQQVQRAKQQGVAVVLSPIYWDLRNIDWQVAYVYPYGERKITSVLGHIHPFLPVITRRIVRYPFRRKLWQWSRNMLVTADLLLPNSYAELELLALLFNVPYLRAKAVVVPNAVEPGETVTEPETDYERLKLQELPSEYVLEVGRIEPIKGQSTLIQALSRNPDIPLVFIGRGLETAYGRYCIQLGKARGNTYFVGEIPYRSLPLFYRRAKVHALPSLRESPGLATLEAAIHGANCVVSYYGPVNEYFGSFVWYCNPTDIDSIRSAILGAWSSPRKLELGERIRKEFTWEIAAQVTLAAYEQLLRRKKISL
ncbi:glycosyltransferase [Neomoorella mulderi]|uniref:Glycogen synthase n=1 Tax=Moorella mulderi DSM 14980 TaxID=1122241 RepID=A0A151AYW2_9FIRM|nr:glycosyltransferase [Moorella mulderi]KYH32828.1 glycogen synthase [Moorella mulderi DSM 14980]